MIRKYNLNYYFIKFYSFNPMTILKEYIKYLKIFFEFNFYYYQNNMVIIFEHIFIITNKIIFIIIIFIYFLLENTVKDFGVPPLQPTEQGHFFSRGVFQEIDTPPTLVYTTTPPPIQPWGVRSS